MLPIWQLWQKLARMTRMKIIGSYVSPYVRKVLACLALKGLDLRDRSDHALLRRRRIRAAVAAAPHPGAGPGRSGAHRFHGDLRLAGRGLSRPSVAPRRSRRPRPGALARGICRHAARRRLHLGPVLPEGRPPHCLGRAGRCGADRKDAGRGRARRARLSGRRSCRRQASCSARSASPTSRSPASSATPLMPASRPTPRAGRATAAFVERALAHPCFAATYRFEEAQISTNPAGPPPGPARRRRAFGRRERRHARAAEGHHDALTSRTARNSSTNFSLSYTSVLMFAIIALDGRAWRRVAKRPHSVDRHRSSCRQADRTQFFAKP